MSESVGGALLAGKATDMAKSRQRIAKGFGKRTRKLDMANGLSVTGRENVERGSESSRNKIPDP
jgi:hypothetical protein